MAIDRSIIHPAFILHRRPYSNTSLLLECFTISHGRFPVVAKGVKRGNSSSAGMLQPFHPLLIRWSGKGEVKTLNSHESSAPPFQLQGQVLYCGFYINELLTRLLQREDPHEHLFGIYNSTLSRLSLGESMQSVLRFFEIELLEQLGFGLVLDRNAEDDSPLVPRQRYHYELERGPVPCSRNDPSGIMGTTLIGLRSGTLLDKASLIEARTLTRYVLRHYLGERPLKSRELFRTSGER